MKKLTNFDLDEDMKPLSHSECFSADTDVYRRVCITTLMGISVKYDIPNFDANIMVNAIMDYVNRAVDDVYKSAKR